MARQQLLTDHNAIRAWAAARMGVPAVVDVSSQPGVQPHLLIAFDQVAYEDQDQAERPPNAGGFELVGWDEWFRIFDDAGLALAVLPEQPGVLDNRHQFIKRDDR
ncbi:MAG: hypothetical protein ACT6RL_19095 [Neoaquamicrobium sediminum]|uniref:hypothetical protein n=1 Tax=Neoaquamicrobium sediminum TaxID=1849104 RepID=UPI00403517B1